MGHAEAYERSYRRILELVDESDADVEVPTCPGWTVKDLVAHQANFLELARSGNPREAFSQDWGEKGVEERRDRSLQECIDEWSRELQGAGDLFESGLAPVAVADVIAHEQDIRTALDRPGARDDGSFVTAAELGLNFLEGKSKDADLPVLKIVTDDIDKQIGEGEPAITLRTSNYELLRTLHGRRTIDQVREMEWDGDPEPWMSTLFLFGPTDRVVEK